MTVTAKDIQHAYERIHPFIYQTPVLQSFNLNREFGGDLFFKCENLQRVGAFKIRGAINSVLQLTPEQKVAGVATHSSGNHAAAVACAAQEMGITAHIVMPKTAPVVKIENVKKFNGQISFCEPTLESRESTLSDIMAKTGAHFIPPYNHPHTIAGQGTCALELMSQVDQLDAILVPVGGGGLISGISTWAKNVNPAIQVIGVEPAGANDAFLSFRSGHVTPVPKPASVADGLLTTIGSIPFSIIQKHVDDMVFVDDDLILAAMKILVSELRTLIEPSAAITFAWLIQNRHFASGKRIALIITGGNTDRIEVK